MGEESIIVIDNGSRSCKIGWSGDDRPVSIIPSVVGVPLCECEWVGLGSKKDSYIGNEAQSLRSILSLQYPIQHGVIKNWDNMEKLWRYAIENELKVDSEDGNIFLTDPPLSSNASREKMTEYMFELFNVSAMNVANQGLLSMYASGRTTGTVFSIGEGVFSIYPIYEGYANAKSNITRTNLAGSDITDHLMKILTERGYEFSTSAEREIVRDIKEKLCYVSEDFDLDMSTPESKREKTYELPDGQLINIGNERIRATEILFQPNLAGLDQKGIHQLLYDTITNCELDTRKDLCKIVFSGGTTLLPGLKERLRIELEKMAPHTKITLIDDNETPVNEKDWIGGSIYSLLVTYSWVCSQDYDEDGPYCVHRKCKI